MILLVEDSADDEELVKLALQQAGFANQVRVARDGEQALDALAELPAGVRLVVLDLKLPKLNGFELLRQIRANPATAQLPVVVFTSSDAPEDIRRAYEAGANAYVCKPVEFDHYAEVVRQIGSFWINLNRKP
jgi:two-component system, response regulator